MKTPKIFLALLLLTLADKGNTAENWPVNLDVPKEDAICFALYTVHNNTLKMTAQLYPLANGVERVVALQVQDGDQWRDVAATVVSDEDSTGASMRRAPPSAACSGCSPDW